MSIRQRFALEVAALALALAAVVAGVAWPTVQRIRQLHQELVEQQVLLETRHQQGLSLKRLKAQLAAGQEQLALLAPSLLARDQDELTFITTIEQLASARGLTTQLQIDQRGERTASQLLRLPVQLNWRGDFPLLLAALRDLERLPQPLAWRSLRLVAGRDSVGQVDLQLSGASHWYSH